MLCVQRERERERQTDRARQTDREKQTDRQRQTDRERQTDRQRERERRVDGSFDVCEYLHRIPSRVTNASADTARSAEPMLVWMSHVAQSGSSVKTAPRTTHHRQATRTRYTTR